MKILLVEAHPDDATISCSGTLIRIKREHSDWQIKLVYFAPCTEAPENAGHIEEHKKACEMLGIDEVITYDFPRDGYLEVHKQEIRNILWKLRELYQPDIVLCPSIHEFHQDHRAVADCCLTIFRDTSTILGFEVIRSSTPDFKPNMLVTFGYDIAREKLDIIGEYESQLKARPYFFSKAIFMAHMKMRGTQAKALYAEAFEVMWVRI